MNTPEISSPILALVGSVPEKVGSDGTEVKEKAIGLPYSTAAKLKLGSVGLRMRGMRLSPHTSLWLWPPFSPPYPMAMTSGWPSPSPPRKVKSNSPREKAVEIWMPRHVPVMLKWPGEQPLAWHTASSVLQVVGL